MSIANQILRLQGAKANIINSILAKGIDVPESTKIDELSSKIDDIGNEPPEWLPNSEWEHIDTPNNNEILMVLSDINPYYRFDITCVGGYTIDWGDGNVINYNTGLSTTYKYETPGKVCSLGYTTYKVRIYSQIGNDITYFGTRLSDPKIRYNGLLYIKFGTTKLTTLVNVFNDSSYFSKPIYLESVELPEYLQDCSSFDNAFSYLTVLKLIKMPKYYRATSISFANMCSGCTTLSSINFNTTSIVSGSFSQTFLSCTSLKEVIIPETVNGCSSFSQMFNNCTSLKGEFIMPNINTNCSIEAMFQNTPISKVQFNNTWSNRITNATSFVSSSNANLMTAIVLNLPNLFFSLSSALIFQNNRNLKEITFPNITSGSYPSSFAQAFSGCHNIETINNFPSLQSVTNVSDTFYQCRNLKNISNLENLGNTTSNMDLTSTYSECWELESIQCRNKITGRFILAGSANPFIRAKLSSLIFTNPSAVSTWAGSSPQIDVSRCSLSEAALNALFTSIIATSASFSGKTIRITDNPGANTCDTTIITNAGGTVNKTT